MIEQRPDGSDDDDGDDDGGGDDFDEDDPFGGEASYSGDAERRAARRCVGARPPRLSLKKRLILDRFLEPAFKKRVLERESGARACLVFFACGNATVSYSLRACRHLS